MRELPKTIRQGRKDRMNKLSESKKELLRKFVSYRCEICNKKDLKLIPHRITRGNSGGTYQMRNIKMICNQCHRLIHGGEFK